MAARPLALSVRTERRMKSQQARELPRGNHPVASIVDLHDPIARQSRLGHFRQTQALAGHRFHRITPDRCDSHSWSRAKSRRLRSQLQVAPIALVRAVIFHRACNFRNGAFVTAAVTIPPASTTRARSKVDRSAAQIRHRSSLSATCWCDRRGRDGNAPEHRWMDRTVIRPVSWTDCKRLTERTRRQRACIHRTVIEHHVMRHGIRITPDDHLFGPNRRRTGIKGVGPVDLRHVDCEHV